MRLFINFRWWLTLLKALDRSIEQTVAVTTPNEAVNIFFLY